AVPGECEDFAGRPRAPVREGGRLVGALAAALRASGARAAPAFRLGARLVHVERLPLDHLAVDAPDRRLGLVLVRHLDEGETARLPGELVLDHAHRGHFPERRERLLQILFRDIARQVTDEDVHPLLLLCFAPRRFRRSPGHRGPASLTMLASPRARALLGRSCGPPEPITARESLAENE